LKKMGQAKLAQMGQFYVAVYTRVVRDQRGAVGAIRRVPGPADVAAPVGVEPVHRGVDETMPAIVLAELSRHQRDLTHHRRYDIIVTRARVAGVEVVDMPRRDKVAQGVVRAIGQPLRQVVGPGQPSGHEHVGRPCVVLA